MLRSRSRRQMSRSIIFGATECKSPDDVADTGYLYDPKLWYDIATYELPQVATIGGMMFWVVYQTLTDVSRIIGSILTIILNSKLDPSFRMFIGKLLENDQIWCEDSPNTGSSGADRVGSGHDDRGWRGYLTLLSWVWSADGLYMKSANVRLEAWR